MVHRADDDLYQLRAVSVEDLEHEVDEEDAGPAAADHRDQREVQERRDAGSAQAGAKPGSDGALSEARRQSAGRLPADGAPDAVPLRLLPGLRGGDRDARRALALDQRSLPR